MRHRELYEDEKECIHCDEGIMSRRGSYGLVEMYNTSTTTHVPSNRWDTASVRIAVTIQPVDTYFCDRCEGIALFQRSDIK